MVSRNLEMKGFSFSERMNAFGFIFPALLLLAVVMLYPLLYGIYISFFDTNLLTKFDFVGLGNYLSIFSDQGFWSSIWVTIVFSLGTVLLQLILGMSVASYLNTRIYGRSVFRAVLLIPWMLSMVVGGLLWRWIYNPMYGLLNNFLIGLGLLDQGVAWLGIPDLAMFSVIIAYAWKSFSFSMLMILAGLQSIPKDLCEAAECDGGGRWTVFRHVVLPHIGNIVLITSLLDFFRSFKEFPMIFVMTGGGPGTATNVISNSVRQVAFDQIRFGYSSAMACVMLLLLLISSILLNRMTRSDWR
ncbi:carbohydrate ABC transporter membrane protein 1 (CUT1 family) [Hydrogenispora ethanolica]|uniref:Carbohydrate ABC transporter membrane protein 1 (CUT1 family) n=1 Tax=Hydrogenispora ethanolica TaxID=1082276 RepID=A0A4R1SCG5_HYDET|nr:sugar ABC transporter permease [Hydrogenispora ethanolica]TCL76984.1 carbohydrate ABC transporter membrane protein 1 (CUT1 family) [Hydrogenispora ethanolica]